MKKKDVIIAANIKRRFKESQESDFKKINYFIDNLVESDIYKNIYTLKTEEGVLEYKFRLLRYFWGDKKKNMHHIMNLYFSLHNVKTDNDEYNKIITKFGTILDGYDYKLYMMKELSHMLPPLNLWDQRTKKLDDWQVQTINFMKTSKSVIVKAPTSSGKSFVGYCAGVLFSRILYVCPAKPIAYQVGASFVNMGYKVCYLLNAGSVLSYDDRTNVFVGTPEIIEDYYNSMNVKFDFVVFDEIHNLNKEDDGHIYENLLKYYDCNFLALSATMNNIGEFKEKLNGINPKRDVKVVEYNKRFINVQKWLWSGDKLQILHPLCSTNMNDLTEQFLEKNHQFTPRDSAQLWEKLEEIFESADKEDLIEELSPDNFFKGDTILTLNDTRDYEYMIKDNIVRLSKTEPGLIKKTLESFRALNSENHGTILSLLKECKRGGFLPMIMFNTSTNICTDMFYDIFTLIETSEEANYPHYGDILIKKNELYKKYIEQRKQFSEKIKVSKSNDPVNDKKDKLDEYDKREKTKYIIDVSSLYDNFIHHLVKDKDYIRRKNNLLKEKSMFESAPDFCSIDIFQKHPEFCFSPKESMTGDKIRTIRKEIHKTMGIKISYEHPIFQLLKRGIGLYTEDMPEEYKWILQKLMTDRDIGVVISDRTLCLGIDLPILTTCIIGYTGSHYFSNDDFLQMSGRAGRRGLDVKGNTIFVDVDYMNILNSENPSIVGNEKFVNNRYKCCSKDVSSLFDNYIHTSKLIDENEYTKTDYPGVQWLCRNNDTIDTFLNDLVIINRKIFLRELDDPEIKVLSYFIKDTSRVRAYKDNRVVDLYDLKELNVMTMKIYNHLKGKQFAYVKGVIRDIFLKTKKLIVSHYRLN
tara:strand:+ start:1144 stop:3735 length:2592 start_codon:yes stop_codon:yes gene_type:complete